MGDALPHHRRGRRDPPAGNLPLQRVLFGPRFGPGGRESRGSQYLPAEGLGQRRDVQVRPPRRQHLHRAGAVDRLLQLELQRVRLRRRHGRLHRQRLGVRQLSLHVRRREHLLVLPDLLRVVGLFRPGDRETDLRHRHRHHARRGDRFRGHRDHEHRIQGSETPLLAQRIHEVLQGRGRRRRHHRRRRTAAGGAPAADRRQTGGRDPRGDAPRGRRLGLERSLGQLHRRGAGLRLDREPLQALHAAVHERPERRICSPIARIRVLRSGEQPQLLALQHAHLADADRECGGDEISLRQNRRRRLPVRSSA